MIKINEVTRFYGDICALRGVTFSIEECGIYGVLGAKKSGKTTLLKMLNATEFPDTGTVLINNLSTIDDDIGIKKQVFYLPKEASYFPEMTIKNCIEFIGLTYGVPKEVLQKKIDDVLKKTNLFADRELIISSTNNLCKKRIGIACALIAECKYILLDEPSKNLNYDETTKIHRLISDIATNHVVIVATASLTEVQTLCERVIILKNGQVLRDDHINNIVEKLVSSDVLLCRIKGNRDKLPSVLKGFRYKIRGNSSVKGIFSISIECSESKSDKVSSALVRGGFAILEIKPESASLDALLNEIGEPEEEDLDEFTSVTDEFFALDDEDADEEDEDVEEELPSLVKLSVDDFEALEKAESEDEKDD